MVLKKSLVLVALGSWHSLKTCIPILYRRLIIAHRIGTAQWPRGHWQVKLGLVYSSYWTFHFLVTYIFCSQCCLQLFPPEERPCGQQRTWYVTKVWYTNSRAMEQLGLHVPPSMKLLHTVLCETHVVCMFVHSCRHMT